MGGLHDEFSSELRELGSWALLGELGVCGGRRWYPGSDRGPPGEGTPREEHQESGEKPSSGSGAGEEVKQPRGVREGTSEGRKPRRGKQGLQERLPHRAARRSDAHRAWCHVRTARPPRLEPRPAWKLCLKLLNSYRGGEPKTLSHQPTSFLGCPLPRPDPLPLALGLSFVILPEFLAPMHRPRSWARVCSLCSRFSPPARSVQRPRMFSRFPGCSRGSPDVLQGPGYSPRPEAGSGSGPG